MTPAPDAEMVERMLRAHETYIDDLPDDAFYDVEEEMHIILKALDIPALLAAAHRAGMEAMREMAAKVVEDHQEVVGLKTHKRVLTYRNEDDQHALAFADAIRALPLDATPASPMAGGEK